MNLKALEKALKSGAKKDRLLWQQTDDMHYITNGFFVVQFDAIPVAILPTLLSVFLQTPKQGETLRHHFGVTDIGATDITRIIPTFTEANATLTSLYKKTDKIKLQVVAKDDGELFLIQESWADMINDARVEVSNDAVRFKEGAIMLFGKRGESWTSDIREELKFK